MDDFVAGWDYPMLVVTVAARPHHHGCLIGFHTQTSIEPARLLVCLSKANATTRAALDAAHLGVHVLGQDQQDLAQLFGGESGDWTDKFSDVSWRAGPHGVPVLEEAPAWLVGRVLERLDVGDHVGFLLEPVAQGRRRESTPLRFQQARTIDPGHPA